METILFIFYLLLAALLGGGSVFIFVQQRIIGSLQGQLIHLQQHLSESMVLIQKEHLHRIAETLAGDSFDDHLQNELIDALEQEGGLSIPTKDGDLPKS